MAEHPVIESKPDSAVDDLRLANPWTQLAAYAASIDLATAEDHVHSHIPYGATPWEQRRDYCRRWAWAGAWQHCPAGSGAEAPVSHRLLC